MDGTESSQKPNPRNLQHGISLMKRALKAGGARTLDRRTRVSKALDQWRDELISDLGGSEQISTQQRAIINVAIKTKLLLDSVDAWLLQQPSLINLRKRAVHPVVLQRQQLADSLIRAMVQLGLERKAKVLPSLTEYLNGSKQNPASAPASVDAAQVHTSDESKGETTETDNATSEATA